jgi:hypothetical protein
LWDKPGCPQARRASINTCDLEKQAPSNDHTKAALTTSSAVETNIWSGDDDDDDELDRRLPRMGTRAYREREKREMKQESRDKTEGSARVRADDVVVDMGPVCVEVKHEIVQKEELSPCFTSFSEH